MLARLREVRAERSPQRCHFCRPRKEAELRTPPQNIFRRARPFFAAQIVELGLMKISGKTRAEIGRLGGRADDFPGARSVRPGKPPRERLLDVRMTLHDFGDQALHAALA